ncbi:uncharacterized protein DS421_14g465690 [Arachis hypogaea]|nr:uncharacterized protein DS421_14g465690 [Arachis hypogaea]
MKLSNALLPASLKLIYEALHRGLVSGMKLKCILEPNLLNHLLPVIVAGQPDIMPVGGEVSQTARCCCAPKPDDHVVREVEAMVVVGVNHCRLVGCPCAPHVCRTRPLPQTPYPTAPSEA